MSGRVQAYHRRLQGNAGEPRLQLVADDYAQPESELSGEDEQSAVDGSFDEPDLVQVRRLLEGRHEGGELVVDGSDLVEELVEIVAQTRGRLGRGAYLGLAPRCCTDNM